MTHSLFVPAGQYRAVCLTLELMHFKVDVCGLLKVVDDRHGLSGLDARHTLVWIENFETPVKPEILDMARSRGMLQMKLSDQWARDRYEEQYPQVAARRISKLSVDARGDGGS